MKRTTLGIALGLLATIGAAAFAPAGVRADGQQDNKNLWRNGTIAGAAAALYGLHNHDTVTTVIGAAGAAYSAHRYEQDRHSQDEAKRARERRALYHRNYGRTYVAPDSETVRRYYRTTNYRTTSYSHPASYYRSAGHRTRRVHSRRVCHCPR